MVSGVVLAKNEEKNIGSCLESLKWCDELVVVDDFSEDGTVKIARKFGAKVYQRHLRDNFAAQRNYGLKRAKGKWVLFVDADERVSQDLRKEIIQLLKSQPAQNGFYVRRRDVLWGRELKYGETGKIKLLRLGKKKPGRWARAVHEAWQLAGSIGQLNNPLLHYPHQTLRGFIADIDGYSTLHARELVKEGKRASFAKIILWPKFKFLQNFIFRLGFLDGTPGFVVALLMSFHSWLAWSKLWLRQNR